MARLKRDHSGWHSHGLYKKYQDPKIKEAPVKQKSKKDTKKWCKGKVGVEHDLIRTFYRSYNHGRQYDFDYYNGKLMKYIECSCVTCGKTFYRPNNKSIRLVIPVRSDGVRMPIQVKVDGKAVPIDPMAYSSHHWCSACQMWERN